MNTQHTALKIYSEPAIEPVSEPFLSDERAPKKRRASGIYQITCLATGKAYVGSAVWLAKRRRHHREGLLHGTHENSYLQRSWNKYGPDAFTYSVLEVVEKERLIEREQFHIDEKKAADHNYGFNMLPLANSRIGVPNSPETRKKISEARKGKCFMSPEQIEAFRQRMIGNKHQLGKKATPETIEKMRNSYKKADRFLGHHHSDDAKKLISLTHKDKPLKTEHKNKISSAHKGKTQSIEHRINLALSQTKVKPSQREEIKASYIPREMTMRMLASKYSVSTQTICNVIHNVGVI
jgi:group I intron endonuclease